MSKEIAAWSQGTQIAAYHLHVCSEMAGVSIPRLKCNVHSKGIYRATMNIYTVHKVGYDRC